jgi:two-component system cell cycle sensor histidine kinase/response regulator CckA
VLGPSDRRIGPCPRLDPRTVDREPGRDESPLGHDPLSAALDAAGLAVVELALDRGLIRRWSPAAERILGHRTEDVVGGPDPVGLLPDDVADRSVAGPRDVAVARVVAAEVRRTRADGRPVDLSLTVAPLGVVHGEERCLVLAVDVTTRKRMEDRLGRAERLEAIGRFSGSIAHDFNNVLTAVIGFATLLEEITPAGDPRSIEIREIVAAASRGRALTDQLLTFAKRQAVRPTVVEVNDVIAEMGRMLERMLGDRVRLVLGLDRGAGASVVDRSQLEQVVMNLAINARDAMPDGGTVLIETATVSVDDAYVRTHPEARPGPHVMVGVSDEGVGIPAEDVPSLFEPFFSTKGGNGTGLGLATVYGIVRRAGGHIDVYSEPGFGTTFRVYLPQHRLRPVMGEPPPDRPARDGPAPRRRRGAAPGTRTRTTPTR